jgi:hypothetical protein
LNTEAECSEFLLTFIDLAPGTLFKSVLQPQAFKKHSIVLQIIDFLFSTFGDKALWGN